MKIAHVHADLPPFSWGGVSWQVHGLAKAQALHDHDVTVFSFTGGPAGAPYRVSVLPPLPGSTRGGLARLFLAGPAFARIDASPFDVVHFHGDSHLARPRVPSVRTFYGSALSEMWHATSWRFRIGQALTYPMELIAMLRADRCVGISATTRRALPRVTTLVPCGVDTRVFSPGGERSAHPSILFVGTLAGRKRGRLLVEAFHEVVRPRIPRAELWIVSDEPAAGEGIRSLGRIAEDALADAYRRAWVFCLPSSYEGFGVPYLEAMASGTPVVATLNDGARELTADGRHGLLVPDAELGEALAALLADGPRRDALARAGRERSLEFDWDRIVARYDAIYQDLVTPRSRP
jgi:glycosyltransferase involved in cell wall biosynthesis